MVKSKHQIAKAAFRLWLNCNRPKTGDIYRNMTETKKDFKYSLRQCRKNAEMHKANGLAAALQADETKKSFWQKVNNKNRSSSLPTCDINIVQQTSCEPLFTVVQMQLKTYFFVPFLRPCMHLN